MKILRIINKENKVFIRDDFNFDTKTEIGLIVEPAQGFKWPQWDGSKWVECPVDLIPPQPEKTKHR
jgi:hypothetical protein